MTATMKDKLELIARDNGSEAVMLKLAEECSEYAAAVSKCLIGEGSREEVLKELADVRVVDRQADIVMHPEEVVKVHKIMEAKIERQVERIEGRKQKTRSKGDNIRKMLQTDEGLADFMLEHNICDEIGFCKNTPECSDWTDKGKSIPDEWCRQCLIKWLKEE